jgi:hypothetical protein
MRGPIVRGARPRYMLPSMWRLFVSGVLLWVTLDLANPQTGRAFVFNPDESVDAVDAKGSRPTPLLAAAVPLAVASAPEILEDQLVRVDATRRAPWRPPMILHARTLVSESTSALLDTDLPRSVRP